MVTDIAERVEEKSYDEAVCDLSGLLMLKESDAERLWTD